MYEPTDTMWGDYFTKPLQGRKFMDMRKMIMNEKDDETVQIGEVKECVGFCDKSRSIGVYSEKTVD